MMNQVELLDTTIKIGSSKVQKSHLEKALLGFLGGGLIGLGYFADIRAIASIAPTWGSFASFIGACIFPVGLILVCLTSAELLTGNFMAETTACYAGKIKPAPLLLNFIEIAIFNMIGGITTAYLLSHVTGLLTDPVYQSEVLSIAAGKVAANPLQAFASGIGCNWLVGLAVWLSYGAKDAAGKILAIWFPTMAFVAIGFQHSIANTFVIPAAIFAGAKISWGQFLANFGLVAAGNFIGAGLFVSLFYYLSYRKALEKQEKAKSST